MRSLFAVLLLLLASCSIYANQSSSSALQRAQTLTLAESSVWLKLLHFEKDYVQGQASAIHSQTFFLSPVGSNNPEAELEATIAGMLQPASANPDEHPQCRFPARYQWLKRTLFIPLSQEADQFFQNVECPAFNLWRQKSRAESISVIFATGFLGNPASYYGHTLLKFNQKKSTNINGKEGLLDTAVNFGALVPDNENPVLYVLKGISGFYEAGFSQAKYYHHNQSYGELELRDLWEYKLNLPKDAVDFILAHIWEVQRQKYTYYFFTRNCAFRLGELLEIVEGLSVNPDPLPWVIPQTQIQLVGQTTYQGTSLVKKVTFHPSRQTRLYARYSQLSPTQQKLVEEIINDINFLDSHALNKESLSVQHNILDTLLDYFRYLNVTNRDDVDDLKIKQQKVLARRYQLPPGNSALQLQKPQPPHQGRKPSWVQLSAIHNSDRGSGQLLTLRPAYYDAIDAGPGHRAGAELSMGKISVEVFGNTPHLRELEIARISNINTQATNLPGDGNSAWQLAFGLTPASLKCSNCLVARLQTDRGWSWRHSDKLIMVASIGGVIQSQKHQTSSVFATTMLKGIYSSDAFSAQAEYTKNWYPSQRDHDTNDRYSFTVRKPIAKNWDTRLRYQVEGARELSFGLGYYW